ncbi:MAG: LytTR family transcriptional regulator DNA-binding domain-containing protein [Oscillospiraceae bacterium]|nr:LytTR family transcriptional regulator DNA-binding domain-containing protein [Oscillospiraceae bacterium]
MDTQKLVQLTNNIVQAYYQNDLRLFFEYIDEKVLWYGPAKGQFLSGRQAILDTWGREDNPLHFTLGNVRLDYSTSHPSCYCEVMMSFPVTTHYPNGESIRIDQIIHITWCERKLKGMEGKQPRMLVIHISDLYENHEEDVIYPVHFNQIYKGYMPLTGSGRRICFHGVDHTDHYLLLDSIRWVESYGTNQHAILHFDETAAKVTASIQQIEDSFPEAFLRCHKSYLVNPKYIMQVRRFRVTMADGKELPVPEKKYTAFKKTVREYWERTEQ